MESQLPLPANMVRHRFHTRHQSVRIERDSLGFHGRNCCLMTATGVLRPLVGLRSVSCRDFDLCLRAKVKERPITLFHHLSPHKVIGSLLSLHTKFSINP